MLFFGDPATITAAVAVLIVVVAALLLRTRKPLLTANEAEFFQRLHRALPAYQVFPQVSFAALLAGDGRRSRQARWSIRARFDRKLADFVICEWGSQQVMALIELDDRMHHASANRRRDAMTNAAGHQAFQFQSKQKPTEAEIAALFQHARQHARFPVSRPISG